MSRRSSQSFGKDLLVRYGAIRTTVELKSIYRHFSKLSPGSPTHTVPPRKREINNIRRIISLTQTSHNAPSHYKRLLRIKPHFFHVTSIGWIFLLVFSKSDSRQYYDFSNHSLAFIQFIFRILFLYVTVKKSKRMYRMVGALTFNALSSD